MVNKIKTGPARRRRSSRSCERCEWSTRRPPDDRGLVRCWPCAYPGGDPSLDDDEREQVER